MKVNYFLIFSALYILSPSIYAQSNKNLDETINKAKMDRLELECEANLSSYNSPDIKNLFKALFKISSSENCSGITNFKVKEEYRTRGISDCPITAAGELTDISGGVLKVATQKGEIGLAWDTKHLDSVSTEDYLYNQGFLKKLTDAGVCKGISLTPNASAAPAETLPIVESKVSNVVGPLLIKSEEGCSICYGKVSMKGPLYSKFCSGRQMCTIDITAPPIADGTCPDPVTSFKYYEDDTFTMPEKALSVLNSNSTLPVTATSEDPKASWMGWASTSNGAYPRALPYVDAKSLKNKKGCSSVCIGTSVKIDYPASMSSRSSILYEAENMGIPSYGLLACAGAGRECFDASKCDKNRLQIENAPAQYSDKKITSPKSNAKEQ